MQFFNENNLLAQYRHALSMPLLCCWTGLIIVQNLVPCALSHSCITQLFLLLFGMPEIIHC